MVDCHTGECNFSCPSMTETDARSFSCSKADTKMKASMLKSKSISIVHYVVTWMNLKTWYCLV